MVCVPIFKKGLCPYFLGGITFLFQLLVITRFRPIYFLCLGLFYVFLFYLLYSIWHQIKSDHDLSLPLIIAFTFLLRLPFFFYPQGLIFTSDNALDALQTQEIASTHVPPFFLLNALQHMGTIKYTLAAFLWNIFGHHYLLYTLIQVFMYTGILVSLNYIFRASLPRFWRLLLLIPGFAFIETIFDNSLSLRAGSEFEMVFFFLLGAATFDPTFSSRWRTFLAFYFIFFSIYLHTLGAVLAGAFVAAVVLLILYHHRERLLSNFILPSLSGAYLGLFHWLYYLLFVPKPPALGGWERIGWHFPRLISTQTWSNLATKAKSCFFNIFNYEFYYLIDFFKQREAKSWLIIINQSLIILSALIFALSLGLVVFRLFRFLLKKETGLTTWLQFFFLFLSVAFLAKTLFLEPPLLEPRHNFDLVVAVILAYFIFFQLLNRLTKISTSKKKMALSCLCSILIISLTTIPHYYFYFQMTKHKEELYKELMEVLRKNRVRYLSTDFILAYPIHFLSKRKILVSDSLGPLTIPQFFPKMRAKVDKLPIEKRAYLFFGDEYPARPWHREATAVIKTRLFNNFKKAGIPFRTIKVKYLVLILPQGVTKPPGKISGTF